MIGGGEARAGSLHLGDVRAPALPPVTGAAPRRRVARFSDGAYLTRPEHPRHAMPRCIVKGGPSEDWRGPGAVLRGGGVSAINRRWRGFIARRLSSKAAQPFGAVPSNELSD